MDDKIYLENDYELIYLIKNYNEEALEIIFSKYEKLIYAKIHQYKFPKNQIEDYYQEGRLVLLKAISTFEDKYQKTFTKYFQMLLENRFNSLINLWKKTNNRVFLLDDNSNLGDENNCVKNFDKLDLKVLSPVENQVYFKYFILGNSIEEITESLKMTRKQAYNAIFRIKTKLKKQISK